MTDANVKKMFKSDGVLFPEGGFLHYDRTNWVLIIRTTEKDHKLITTLMKPVTIKTKEDAQQIGGANGALGAPRSSP